MDSRDSSQVRPSSYRRRRSFMLVTFAGLLLLAAGIWIGRGLGNDEGEPTQTPEPRSVVGPTTELNGVPVGYANSEQGAVAAAANFTLAQSVCAHDLDRCMTVMRTIGAPEWQEEGERQARNGLEFASNRFGAGATVSTSLLRYRVASASSDRALVEFWAVTVLQGPKRPEGESVWGILEIDLAWVDNDWRVIGQETDPGPSPEVLQAGDGGEPLEKVIDDFEEFSDAPNP